MIDTVMNGEGHLATDVRRSLVAARRWRASSAHSRSRSCKTRRRSVTTTSACSSGPAIRRTRSSGASSRRRSPRGSSAFAPVFGHWGRPTMWLNRVRTGHRLKEWLMLKLVPVVLGAPVPDIVRVLFYRRDFCGVYLATLQQRLLRGSSDWSIGERELFAAFVSAKNCCRFCIDAHSAIAA